MPLRSLAIPVLLFLAGCATTGTDSGSVDTPQPIPARITVAPPQSAAAVDDHLFVPPQNEDAPAYANVWERVIDRFGLPECSDQEINLRWANWYADRPEYMGRIFKRAQPWIYYIAEELERRDMPGELALLPIVESAFDPFAYSRGRALGTWQFIAATGRRYGLAQNWWYDGRRDVWASTAAALDYLAYMQQMFDGDWLLALAGYNAGEGRVGRQIRRNRAAGRPADYWNLKLPRETRGYVPKLLGLACLFRDAEKYDFEIPDTPDQPVVAAVDIGQQADLVLLSQLSEVPIDVLFTLNPGFNRWATSPEGPHRVVLPLENADRLKERLTDMDRSALMRWDQVVVERGDTLSRLAQRHHVPVTVLRTANELDGDLIRPGQKLRLPRDDQLLVDPLYAAAAAELLDLQSGLISADRLTHRVRSGESLSVIARRYRVSVKDLQRWNNIRDPRTLRAGANLVVFHTPTRQNATSGTVQHIVQRGDSLWSIARKYKVRVNDLKSWNDLDAGNTIQPGQSIRIRL
ncbi:lytic transglycosylase [Elongatibacter sediminis]|uniref:LysM peptidoglycan-binding domain-containing protein n=1 Tax=Elongatibacter sediminis TaxID=3119006 RepID=A0AAW9RGR0_9GAMM